MGRNKFVLLFLLTVLLSSLLTFPASIFAKPDHAGFTDLGGQIVGLTVHKATIGKTKDGQDVVYTVVSGNPAQFAVIDLKTRKLLHLFPLEGATGAWAIHTASDGKIWVGGYRNGHVYHYDPQTEKLKSLGRSPANSDVLYGFTSGSDGSIYGGSFGTANVYQYTKTGEAIDLGSVSPNDLYSLDLAYNADKNVLYVGIGSKEAKVVRFDLTTKEKKEILPSTYKTQTSAYDLNYVKGKLIVKLTPDSKAVVLNPETGEVDPVTDEVTGKKSDQFSMTSRGISPVAPDGETIYYSSNGQLFQYHLTKKIFKPVKTKGKPALLDNQSVLNWGWVNFKEKEYPGKTLVGLVGNYQGQAFRYNPTTGAFEFFQLPIPPQPIDLFHVIASPDGKIYSNAYLNGKIGYYDSKNKKKTQLDRLGQVEGWTWYKGKLYAGTYPDGKLLVYDPNKPWVNHKNPKSLFSLKQDHEQNRPLSVMEHNDHIYMGTAPDYGKLGGTLTVVDLKQATKPVVYRNIVENQTVTSLTSAAGKIWGGTKIDGGTGTQPMATEAKLFTFDPSTKQKIGEYSPIPDMPVKRIFALTTDNKGILWGLADNYLFAFDPNQKQTLWKQQLVQNNNGQGADIVQHPNNKLYIVTDGLLFSIDPMTKQVENIPYSSGLYRITLQGKNLYFKNGTALPIGQNLIRFTPGDSDNAIKLKTPIKSKFKYKFDGM
jgi:streptogramin lyase